MKGLTLTTTIIKKPHVTQILVDGETIVMEATNQTYFNFNGTGSKIWSLFDIGSVTTHDLAHYLQDEYHLEKHQSIQDARQFVEMLIANDLVYLNDSDKEQNDM